MNQGNGFYSEGHLKWFQKHGKALPAHQSHAEDSEENPISKKLKRLEITDWKLEGNLLTAKTEMGPFVQNISTDYILDGVDSEGLPIFRKITLT